MAILIWIAVHLVFHVAPFRGASFTPERWQAVWDCGDRDQAECASHRAGCPRGPMVRDLLDTHIIPGQTTRAQITAMLGPNDWYAPVAVDRQILGRCEMHMLGMCSGFAIDYDSVFVCFDDQGVVSEAGHRQH